MAQLKKEKYTALRRIPYLSRVVEEGETVELTAQQAKYLLLSSKIKPFEPKRKTKPKAKED